MAARRRSRRAERPTGIARYERARKLLRQLDEELEKPSPRPRTVRSLVRRVQGAIAGTSARSRLVTASAPDPEFWSDAAEFLKLNADELDLRPLAHTVTN